MKKRNLLIFGKWKGRSLANKVKQSPACGLCLTRKLYRSCRSLATYNFLRKAKSCLELGCCVSCKYDLSCLLNRMATVSFDRVFDFEKINYEKKETVAGVDTNARSNRYYHWFNSKSGSLVGCKPLCGEPWLTTYKIVSIRAIGRWQVRINCWFGNVSYQLGSAF